MIKIPSHSHTYPVEQQLWGEPIRFLLPTATALVYACLWLILLSDWPLPEPRSTAPPLSPLHPCRLSNSGKNKKSLFLFFISDDASGPNTGSCLDVKSFSVFYDFTGKCRWAGSVGGEAGCVVPVAMQPQCVTRLSVVCCTEGRKKRQVQGRGAIASLPWKVLEKHTLSFFFHPMQNSNRTSTPFLWEDSQIEMQHITRLQSSNFEMLPRAWKTLLCVFAHESTSVCFCKKKKKKKKSCIMNVYELCEVSLFHFAAGGKKQRVWTWQPAAVCFDLWDTDVVVEAPGDKMVSGQSRAYVMTQHLGRSRIMFSTPKKTCKPSHVCTKTENMLCPI